MTLIEITTNWSYIIALLIIFIFLSIIIFWPQRGILSIWKHHKEVDRIYLEDCIKQLYEFGVAKHPISVSDLIYVLEISPDEAKILSDKMIKKHLVNQKTENSLQLTNFGEQKALQIIRAHRIWESHLANKGIDIENIHDEADKYEHFTTAEKINEMEANLGHPKRDPHGDVIPSANGEIQEEKGIPLTQWPSNREARIDHVEDEPKALFTQLIAMGLVAGAKLNIIKQEPNRMLIHSQHLQHMLAPETAEKIFVVETPPEAIPLGELLAGEKGAVTEIDESGKSIRRLLDIGLVPGSKVETVRIAPLGDPIEFRIKGALISLRRHEANKIWIKRIQEN